MLTEQQERSIKEEAERLYKLSPGNDSTTLDYNNRIEAARSAYIAAATKYQERAKGLLEAAKELLRFKSSIIMTMRDALQYPDSFIEAVQELENAITNYNESLKTINNGEST